MYLVPSKEELVAFLQSSQLFRRLSLPALEALLEDFELIHVEGQQTLIREGEVGNDLYMVIRGRLRSFADADTPEERTLSESGIGEIVGEISLLVDRPRTATVRTIRDSVLLKLSKKHYERFVTAFPEAGVEVAKACITRLLSASQNSKVGKNVRTATLIPLSDAHVSDPLIDDITASFGKDSTLLLSSQRVEAELGPINKLLNEAERFERLLRFLSEQENVFRYVLYKADSTWTPWTEFCIHQADIVLMMRDGNEVENQDSRFETALLNKKSMVSVIPLIVRHKGTRLAPAYDWIRKNKISTHHFIDVAKKSDAKRVARLIKGTSTGLVLSGGGARGLAHIGVIRALEQAQIPIDMIGGTSSGSIVAAAYAMGYDSYEIERVLKEVIVPGSRLDFTYPYLSLASGKRLVRALKSFYGDRVFEELPKRMFSVSTNITKNEVAVHDTGPVWEGIRASVSLPGIYPPVFANGDLLVDGGVLNNLPVEIMNEHFRAGKILASMVLIARESYHSSLESASLSGFRVLANKVNPFAPKQEIPALGSILMRTMNLNQLTHQLAQAKVADFSFMLNLGQYGLMDFERHSELVEQGFRQAEEQIKALRDTGPYDVEALHPRPHEPFGANKAVRL